MFNTIIKSVQNINAGRETLYGQTEILGQSPPTTLFAMQGEGKGRKVACLNCRQHSAVEHIIS